MATAKLLDILVNEENDVKKLIVASSMSIYGEGAYECDSCGEVHPKLREEEQLRRREWELRCPNCGEIVKPIPTSEEKPLHEVTIISTKHPEGLKKEESAEGMFEKNTLGRKQK